LKLRTLMHNVISEFSYGSIIFLYNNIENEYIAQEFEMLTICAKHTKIVILQFEK